MPSIASSRNIIADQGATFTLTTVKKDDQGRVVPLADHFARMQVRTSYAANIGSTVIFNLTTENDYISIDAAKGQITVTIPSAEMTTVSSGKYLYDLELIYPDDTVERLLMGTFTIRAEVTR